MTSTSATAPHPREMLCIVLSFNGYADTVACLDSLRATQVPGFDILVVDNASKDDIPARLAAAYPDMELLALPENLGWAGGNNAGIKIGLDRGYRWICLLNNDTVFPAGQVQAWLDTAAGSPPCLLHPSIYYWDEPEVAQLDPGADGSQAAFEPAADNPGMIRMSYAYGACLAVHREIFERVGTFDERFFLQLEETDFYLRAVALGYQALCAPAVRIFHKESRAFGGNRAAIKTYYSTRNTLLLIEKNRRGAAAKLDALKQFYWTLSSLAAEPQPGHGKPGTARWLLSGAPGARAVRAGVCAYLLRRFGRAPDGLRERLSSYERSYAAAGKSHAS
jgi:GT2 family glycosyltransferase